MTSQVTDKAIASTVGTLPGAGETITLSISGSVATTGTPGLARGHYDICSTVSCWVCADIVGGDNCTTSDSYLPAGLDKPFQFETGKLYVSAITGAASGVLHISPRVAVGGLA